ncbi:MAG: NAD(+) synthetase [Candidatus Cloacimonadota bacterium]|nr:MAG: NAD(+) synthetase [Candidatus Cloacimonadota bacterium]PIE78098.1 MAG: NAD(+) synthetase [Candidatus Delongbacteria bacterium]
MNSNPKKSIDISVDFIKDQFSKAGFKRGIIGLSGGLDSAVVAYLAVKALGKENVEVVKMPYKTSSRESIIDANLVIDDLGIKSREVDISNIVDAISKPFPKISQLRLGNIMARTRMIVLFDLAAETNSIVMGTSNRSELLLGYGTLFGDLASIINPIAPFYKSEIFEIGRELGVPTPLIVKKPSADLWEDQSDEDDLGFSYATADSIMINGEDKKHISIKEFGEETVNKVLDRVKANSFKFNVPIKLEL